MCLEVQQPCGTYPRHSSPLHPVPKIQMNQSMRTRRCPGHEGAWSIRSFLHLRDPVSPCRRRHFNHVPVGLSRNNLSVECNLKILHLALRPTLLHILQPALRGVEYTVRGRRSQARMRRRSVACGNVCLSPTRMLRSCYEQRADASRQGVVLTDLQSFLDCQ